MRIKPLETGLSKAGGKADVEAAELLPRQFPNPSESSKAEYIAVKKLRVDETVNDDRVLVVSRSFSDTSCCSKTIRFYL